MKNLVIDKRVIRNNIRAIKEKADGAAIYADLSANAYGMGLWETAQLLRDEGIRSFIISVSKDASLLRKNGFTEERLMMLRSTAAPDALAELIDLGVICTVGSYDSAVALNGVAESRKTVCEVQIKIDTGLAVTALTPPSLTVWRQFTNICPALPLSVSSPPSPHHGAAKRPPCSSLTHSIMFWTGWRIWDLKRETPTAVTPPLFSNTISAIWTL